MLEPAQIRPVVVAALAEDAPSGDVTSQVFVPAGAVATADVVAREPGVMAGVQVLEVVFAEIDPAVEVVLHIDDGEEFTAGDVLATVSGPARAMTSAYCVHTGSAMASPWLSISSRCPASSRVSL